MAVDRHRPSLPMTVRIVAAISLIFLQATPFCDCLLLTLTIHTMTAWHLYSQSRTAAKVERCGVQPMPEAGSDVFGDGSAAQFILKLWNYSYI